MTKKATRRGNAMSLRDFYETAPGEAPIETCLPSKPGVALRDSRAVAVTEYPSKFAPPQRDPNKQASSYKRHDHTNGYGSGATNRSPASGYIKASYEGQEHGSVYGAERVGYTEPLARSQPRGYPQQRYPSRGDQYSNSPYQFDQSLTFGQPPPPPPPRRPAATLEQAPCQPPPPPPPPLHAPAAEAPASDPSKPAPKVELSQLTQELHNAALLNGTNVTLEVKADVTELVTEDVAEAAEILDTTESDLSSSAPKNDWAEKMARNALERMAHAKSSLLAGTNTGFCLDSASDSASDDTTGSEHTFVKPTHPFERPRLNLKPRSEPLPITQPPSSASSPEPGSAAAGTTPNSDPQRRRLNLQPRSVPLSSAMPAKDTEQRSRLQLEARSKPLADTEANKDSSARKSTSIFGAARPREEVLKERGVDPAAVVVDRLNDRLGYGSFSGSVGSRPSSRAASVASGVSEDDAWHTVSNKKANPKQQQSQPFAGDSYDIADDVFFNTAKPTFGRSHVRSFDHDSLPGSGYGSPAPYSGGLADSNAGEDDGPVFRRSLPVRAGKVF